MNLIFEALCTMEESQLRSELNDYANQSPADAMEMLVRLIDAPRGEVKAESLVVMQKYFPEMVESHALTLLSDRDWLVRTTAIHMLTRNRSDRAQQQICRMLLSDEDECVRNWAVHYLSQLGTETSIPALEMCSKSDIGHDHEGVRIAEHATKAISRIRSRSL